MILDLVMGRARAAWTAFVLTGTLLTLAACSSSVPSTVRIGVAVPLSGPESSRGRDLLNGALLAAEELNQGNFKIRGKPVKFEIVQKDDKGDAATVVQVAQELADDDIQAVIGHVSSQHTLLAIPVYAKKGLPHLFTSTSKELMKQGKGNTFRLVASDRIQAQALASFAVDHLNGQRLAALVEPSTYGRGLYDDLATALRQRWGKEVVLKSEFDAAQQIDPDVARQIKQYGVDVVIVLGREAHVVNVLDRLRQVDYTPVSVVATNAAKTTRMSKAEVDVRGLYATTSTFEPGELAAGRPFLQRFDAKFHSDPVWGAHYAYDAVYLLADAMRQAGSTEHQAVIAQLKHSEPNAPVNAQLRFDAEGEQAYPQIGVYKSEGGAWVPQMRSANW